jgi:hypothetical protein
MEFTGLVLEVIDKSGTSKTGNAFTASQIVVTDNAPEYPQTVVFDTFGDKFSNINVGDEVEVSYNFKANEYNGKWYNKVNGWKINVMSTKAAITEPVSDPLGVASQGASATDPALVYTSQQPGTTDGALSTEDDLPF